MPWFLPDVSRPVKTLEGGRIMGATPNPLVVPPEHEVAARALLTAEDLPGGGTNVWRGSADLVVTPYLQE